MLQIKYWDQELNYAETLEILRALALAHLNLCTVKPETLERAIIARDWAGVCSWELTYDDQYSVYDLIHIRQALGFFTKLEQLDIGVDKEMAARLKFLLTEAKCRETNALFAPFATSGIAFSFPKGVDQVLYLAQQKIARLLGDVPSFKEMDFKFSPGATSTVPKHKSCARIKLSTAPSCTTNLLSELPSFFREVPHWSCLHSKLSIDADDWLVETVNVALSHGKLSFVPKNAKTYRAVMTEPSINGVIQAGYGRHIAGKLRRVGQDIRDQTKNQRLAREGSLTGDLATLDLVSASDLISTGLAGHLLPVEWYLALSKCRTPYYTDGDGAEEHFLHKFSSMGNGFTFPLQTLIFWSLVTSCADVLGVDVSSRDSNNVVSVYGDDIICPVGLVDLVIKVFTCCGFEVNTLKSYWSGPFRESCGADYYKGIDIRPYYQKNLISGETLFSLHNYYVRNWEPEMAKAVLEYIAPSLRIWGPDGYGDGHLIGDWIPRLHKRSEGWAGYLFDTYRHLGRSHKRALIGDRVLPVYSVYVRDDEDLGLSEDFFARAATSPGTFLRMNRSTHNGKFFLKLRRFEKKDGVAVESLPGTRGYKRISIYTLKAC